MYNNLDFFAKVKIHYLENFPDVFQLNFRRLKLLCNIYGFLNNKSKQLKINEYIFRSVDIVEYFGYSNNYKILKEDLNILSRLKVNNKIIFKHIIFRPKLGLISFGINSKYKNTFSRLKSNFIIFELKNIIRLKYDFSIILYCLLKQYEPIKYRIIYLDDLYKFANIDKDTKISRFIENKLKIRIEEINKYSDIYITYHTIKSNRYIIGIYFNIYRNKYRIEFDEQLKLVYMYLKKNYNINTNLTILEHFINVDGFNKVYNKAITYKVSSNKDNTKLFYQHLLKEQY
jgi:hypothetical protein